MSEQSAESADERCVVCHCLSPRHAGLCCDHRYDEQPDCQQCETAEKAQVRLTREDHYDQCIRGWQEIAPLWTVRRCEHGRIQRREPGPTPMRHDDHRWVDLSRFEHPILWSRARRALRKPTVSQSEAD